MTLPLLRYYDGIAQAGSALFTLQWLPMIEEIADPEDVCGTRGSRELNRFEEQNRALDCVFVDFKRVRTQFGERCVPIESDIE